MRKKKIRTDRNMKFNSQIFYMSRHQYHKVNTLLTPEGSILPTSAEIRVKKILHWAGRTI